MLVLKPSAGICPRIPNLGRWQILTVAHKSRECSTRRTAARTRAAVGGLEGRRAAAVADVALAPAITAIAASTGPMRRIARTGGTYRAVTDHPEVRSEGVNQTLPAPVDRVAPSSWERFEALYRSSRDD